MEAPKPSNDPISESLDKERPKVPKELIDFLSKYSYTDETKNLPSGFVCDICGRTCTEYHENIQHLLVCRECKTELVMDLKRANQILYVTYRNFSTLFGTDFRYPSLTISENNEKKFQTLSDFVTILNSRSDSFSLRIKQGITGSLLEEIFVWCFAKQLLAKEINSKRNPPRKKLLGIFFFARKKSSGKKTKETKTVAISEIPPERPDPSKEKNVSPSEISAPENTEEKKLIEEQSINLFMQRLRDFSGSELVKEKAIIIFYLRYIGKKEQAEQVKKALNCEDIRVHSMEEK